MALQTQLTDASPAPSDQMSAALLDYGQAVRDGAIVCSSTQHPEQG